MRRKIRPELQVTPLEAGVCCAAMLLHANGCRRSTAKLREEFDLGRGGSTLPQLAQLFSSRGVPVEVRQAVAEEAKRLPGPFVAGWGNTTYVVVEEVGTRTVTIVDPAIGRRTAPVAEFDESYSGYYLFPDFHDVALLPEDPVGDHPKPFAQAMRATAGPLAGVAAMSLVVYATDIGAPYLTQRLVDAALGHGSRSVGTQFLPWILAICAAVGVGVYGRAVFIARSAVDIGRKTSEAVLDHLLGLPYRYFDSRQPGELAYRLGGLSAIRDSLSEQLFTGFFQVGGVLVYLGFLFHISVPLGLISAGFVAAMLGVLFGSRALFYSAIQNELSQTGRMLTEQLEAIQSILTIKTRPDRKHFLSRWRLQNEVSLAYLRRRMLLQGGVNAIMGILQFSAPVVTLVAGVEMWQRQAVSLGQVFAALAVASLLFATTGAIYSSVAMFLLCRTYARRVEDITMTEQQPVGETVLRALGPIDVQGLRFRYTKDAPEVLRGVSLTVLPGDTVAIVGHSGSGKSTLAKTMLGLYAPGEGHVHYNGVAVTELAPSCLFGQLSFVPQDVTLETATVHDNVALGKPVSRVEVERACRLACVHDDIMGFSAGYDTMINNLGANLSGGQRQRVALARAILTEPEVLVLDEATSSLDSMTEATITSNLKSLGCTTIVIAHRLASVVDADVAYVMSQGEIVERGRHEELMGQHGVYCALFAGQAQPVGVA